MEKVGQGLKKRRLTPSEIRNKDFGKKLFGYDPEEVDGFLMEVANAFNELLKENEALRVKTPEYKAQQIIEKARKEIEKIIEQKKKEKALLEKEKREIEIEIEKLRLAQKKMADKLKFALIEMTQILEELKKDASGKKKEERSRNRGEGPAQVLKESDRKGGGGEAEGEGDGSSGGGKGE